MEVVMFRRKIAVAVALFALCFLCIGCEEDESSPIVTPPAISGNLIKVDGCKSGLTKSAADNDKGCVQFTYDAAARTLTLLHVNAAFNCCPEEIKAAVSVENGIIRITESESGGNCLCNCLYDLHILVENVPPQSFGIVVEEPLLNDQETPIEFTVDLSKVSTGEHCVARNFYPWGV
jgi:hypothetical protein